MRAVLRRSQGRICIVRFSLQPIDNKLSTFLNARRRSKDLLDTSCLVRSEIAMINSVISKRGRIRLGIAFLVLKVRFWICSIRFSFAVEEPDEAVTAENFCCIFARRIRMHSNFHFFSRSTRGIEHVTAWRKEKICLDSFIDENIVNRNSHAIFSKTAIKGLTYCALVSCSCSVHQWPKIKPYHWIW